MSKPFPFIHGQAPLVPNKPKHVLVIGFGALGAIYSLVLKRGDKSRVTSVARSNYDILTIKGLEVRSQKYGYARGWKPHRLCRSVAEAADDQYDYVVLTTKAIPELVKTSSIIEPFLTKEYNSKFKQPTYVVMQNGLNVEVDLYNAVKALNKGDPKIISTAVYIGANMVEPNLVEHNEFDRVFLGIYRHNDRLTTTNTPYELELLNGFAPLIASAGSTVAVVPEIQRIKFAKNFWNVAFSGIATLTQCTLPGIFRPPPDGTTAPYSPYRHPDNAELIDEYTIPLIKGIFDELIALGRALGYPNEESGVSDDLGHRILEGTRNLHEKPDSVHIPSMLLDSQKGLPIEVEVIFGEVVRMAKERNVPVPRVETLYGILLVVQNQILRKRLSR